MGDIINDFQNTINDIYMEFADRAVCNNYLGQEEGTSEEEREQSIKEYLSLHSMMEKCLYLCKGTTLFCPAGEGNVVLQSDDHSAYVNGKPLAIANDCVVGKDIISFGRCARQSQKENRVVMCNPKFAYNKWFECCSKMKVGDADSINENSYLICLSGGGVKVSPVLTTEDAEDEEEIKTENENSTDIETQIQNLIDQIKGEEIKRNDKGIYSYSELINLPTVEILARMIYAEDRSAKYSTQNAIAFSVINRLNAGNWLSKGSDNNLYGILTSKGQYSTLFKAEGASKITDGQYNAYRPPIDENAGKGEKEGWENAKRLAAITCLAVELYGDGEETMRGRTVKEGDEEVRDNMIEFMESQKDSKGREIKNEIGRYQSFRPPADGKSADDYKNEEKIAFVDEKGAIVGNVFREK